MMDKWQNEKGYTLLLTLVIITLIIIFFSSFALSAMNQEKQVKKTDDNYEVTAVAEMGIEHYKAKILNEMKTAEIATQELINNTTLQNAERNTRINTIFENLKTSLRSYSTDNFSTPKIFENSTSVDSSNNSLFYLDGKNPPSFSLNNSIFTIGVIGRVEDKTKSIIAKFNFPASIATSNSSTDGVGYIIDKPIFSVISIPNGIPVCSTSITSMCTTTDMSYINNLNNSKVYFTGTQIQNILDNSNFNTSILYATNTNELKVSNLLNAKDLSFYINGNAKFDTLSSNGAIFIQVNGNSSFSNISLLKKDLTIYTNGFASFSTISQNQENTPSKKDGLILYAKGASFQSINNIENNTFEIDGITNFNAASTFKSSLIHSTGLVTATQLIFLDKSEVFIDSGIVQSQKFEVQGSSKVCIKGTYSLGTLEIANDSDIYILDTNKNTSKYTIGNLKKSPTFVSNSKFNEVCTPPLGSVTTQYTSSILPNDNTVINEIIYE